MEVETTMFDRVCTLNRTAFEAYRAIVSADCVVDFLEKCLEVEGRCPKSRHVGAGRQIESTRLYEMNTNGIWWHRFATHAR